MDTSLYRITGEQKYMSKKISLILLSFLIIWTILTILSVTWGAKYDWPDNVHTDYYGFPFVLSTQTLSTIVGPVNLLAVDVTALIMDLTLWLGIMLITASALLYFLSKKDTNKEKE